MALKYTGFRRHHLSLGFQSNGKYQLGASNSSLCQSMGEGSECQGVWIDHIEDPTCSIKGGPQDVLHERSPQVSLALINKHACVSHALRRQDIFRLCPKPVEINIYDIKKISSNVQVLIINIWSKICSFNTWRWKFITRNLCLICSLVYETHQYLLINKNNRAYPSTTFSSVGF